MRPALNPLQVRDQHGNFEGMFGMLGALEYTDVDCLLPLYLKMV
jgi:hypothetical protein